MKEMAKREAFLSHPVLLLSKLLSEESISLLGKLFGKKF